MPITIPGLEDTQTQEVVGEIKNAQSGEFRQKVAVERYNLKETILSNLDGTTFGPTYKIDLKDGSPLEIETISVRDPKTSCVRYHLFAKFPSQWIVGRAIMEFISTKTQTEYAMLRTATLAGIRGSGLGVILELVMQDTIQRYSNDNSRYVIRGERNQNADVVGRLQPLADITREDLSGGNYQPTPGDITILAREALAIVEQARWQHIWGDGGIAGLTRGGVQTYEPTPEPTPELTSHPQPTSQKKPPISQIKTITLKRGLVPGTNQMFPIVTSQETVSAAEESAYQSQRRDEFLRY